MAPSRNSHHGSGCRCCDAGTIQGATNTPVASKAIEIETLTVADHVSNGQQVRAVDLPVFEQFGVADRPALRAVISLPDP